MAANESQALSQDDIDALLSEVQGDAPPSAAVPVASAPPPAAAAVAEAIAALANEPQPNTEQVHIGDTPSLTRRRAVGSSAEASKGASTSVSGASSAPPAMTQDDIDSLVAQTIEKTDGAKPVMPALSKPVSKPVTQPVSKPQTVATPAAIPAGLTRAAKKDNATKSEVNPGTDIERLLASVESSAQQKAKNAMDAIPGMQPGMPLDQEDIDKLLAELGATVSSAPTPPATGPGTKQGTGGTKPKTGGIIARDSGAVLPQSSQPTLALSTEELDALVDKHTGGDTEGGVEMIDQSDIDALVKQLATATNEPDNQKISEALAKHGDEIDRLMEKAGDDRSTMDAVDLPKDPTVKTVPIATQAMPMMTMPSGPVMAHLPASAFRGTRWLLAAAVLLLAMCAGILAMVVGAVRGLSLELRQERVAQLAPSDDYHDDFRAAQGKLASPDEQESAKGVLFLERLQKRYPDHERDIALLLARHHRANGALARAAREYAVVAEGSAGPLDDPRIYLEFAECLFQQQDEASATRQVYTLLANESFYRSERDPNGLARAGDELARNRQAVQDAYLALGRMLSIAWQQGDARLAQITVGHDGETGHGAALPHAGAKPSLGHGAANESKSRVDTPAATQDKPDAHKTPAPAAKHVSGPANAAGHEAPTKAAPPSATDAHGEGRR